MDGAVLGADGDATLAFDVATVHDAGLPVLADNAALLEERVDQRGLAVVDMGDDRNISDMFVLSLHETGS